MKIKTLKELSHHVGEHVMVTTCHGIKGVCVVVKNNQGYGLASDDEAFKDETLFWTVDDRFLVEGFKPFKFGHYCVDPEQLTEELTSVSIIRKTRSDKGKKRTHYTRKVEGPSPVSSKFTRVFCNAYIKTWEDLKDHIGEWLLAKDGKTEWLITQGTAIDEIVLLTKSKEPNIGWHLESDDIDTVDAGKRVKEGFKFGWCVFTDDALFQVINKSDETVTDKLIRDRKPLPKQVEPVFGPTFAVKSGMDLEYYLKEIIITLKEIKEKI